VHGDTRPEILLNRALEKATLDLLNKAEPVDQIEKIILSTNSEKLAKQLTDRNITLIKDKGQNFNFGKKLEQIIKAHSVGDLLYFGGGSGVLLDTGDLTFLADFLSNNYNVSVSNNFYSTDFIGLSPAPRLLEVSLPSTDNQLGWKSREAGYTPYELERTAKTQFDIDSPVDLIPLRLSKPNEINLSSFLEEISLDTESHEEVLPHLTNSQAKLALGGRIGASTWSFVEHNAACRVNIYSENRGMHADTRLRDNGLPSLLASLAEEKGFETLFSELLASTSGLILDTRIIYRHFGIWPPARDRYWSDLGKPNRISVDLVKKMTEAALGQPKPILLGGHSLVSGSLYLMVDIAWNSRHPKSKQVRPRRLSLSNR
ncbi:MAG: hypothetical protein ACLFO3_07580, partial [Candidatus Acetothermia bacterium]